MSLSFGAGGADPSSMRSEAVKGGLVASGDGTAAL
jgi:hypothetical protein